MKRILIIDDSLELGRLLRAALLDMEPDLAVMVVPSAEEALLELNHQPVDLVVSDIRLPGMSGIELVPKIRQHLPDMKIILITGFANASIESEVQALNIQAYLRKPMEITDFLNEVNKALGITQSKPGEEPAPPAGRLQDLLAELRQEVEAGCVFLLDERGMVIAQAGSFPSGPMGEAWQQHLGGLAAASGMVGQLFQKHQPESAMTFRGRDYEILATPLGQFTLGLTLKGGQSRSRLGLAIDAVLVARNAFITLLDSISGESVPSEASPMVSFPVEEIQEGDTENLEDLAMALEKSAHKTRLKTASTFWEAAAQQEKPAPTRADGLSYDEARKLGLTPDEQ